MSAAFTALVCALLIIAAVTDWRSRTIPDIIPVSILLLGVVELAVGFTSEKLLWTLAGLVVPSLLMAAGYFLGHRVGGGDLKISASTGFFFGLHGLCVMFVFALIGGATYCAIKHESSIPFATFLAPAAITWSCFVYFFGIR